MISEIEKGIIDTLQENWDAAESDRAINLFDIGRDFDDVNRCPAIALATETIGVREVGDGVIEFKPRISIYQVFENVANPAQRRSGLYPIVIATIRILMRKTLGLVDENGDPAIDPIIPVSCAEVNHAALKERGLICYRTIFETSFTDTGISDDDVVQLLSEGLSYYLGNNENAGATDALDFTE